MSAGLFTYVLRWDTGFAPNPYFGICTLATCKSGIRKSAEPGDWVAGIGSTQNQLEGRLVYAMLVEEKLSFDEYWSDPRFAEKIPNLAGSREQRCGDNIYHQTPRGEWVQKVSLHSNSDCSPNHYHMNRDTRVPSVLVSKSFAYYGATAIPIPEEFRDWEGQDYFASVRDYRRHFPDDLHIAFTSWLDSLADIGKAGEPLHHPNLTRPQRARSQCGTDRR